MDFDGAASVASPSVAEAAPPPAQPRLGIAHLLIWMTGAAVCLAVQRVISGESGVEGEFSVFVLLIELPYALLHGMLLGCLAIGATRLARGVPILVHPGHWLAMLWGMTTVGGWLVGAVYAAVANDPFDSWTAGAFYVANTLNHVLFAAGCVLGLRQGRFEGRWNAVLVAVSLQQVLAAASGLVLFSIAMLADFMPGNSPFTWVLAGTVITALAAFVLIPLLIFAAWGDRRRGISRDWMHWVGALSILWEPAAAWMVVIVNLVGMASVR
jgi:hypothetical protein